MNIRGVTLEPSERLSQQTSELSQRLDVSLNPVDMMRDYYAVNESSDRGSLLTAVVGDMANNLTGTIYESPQRAAQIGLPLNYKFNGGHLGSMELRDRLALEQATGHELVEAANGIISDLYLRLGAISGHEAVEDMDPADRFTGYFSHVRVTPRVTTVTSVGDVLVWANGVHVAGQDEKPIDAAKTELVDALAAQLSGDNLRDEHVKDTIRAFAGKVGLREEVLCELEEQLSRAVAATDSPGRQTAYRPVDDVITPWQIRYLQNPESGQKGPFFYGAVDGTHTPESFVQSVELATPDIDTLVIATDGLRPEAGQPVHDTTDLAAVNSAYGEKTAIALARAIGSRHGGK